MRYKERADRQIRELRKKENVRILAIETSCDETAAAVVENGRRVLSNTLFTQIAIHAEYGGVVPEIASRNHLEKLPYIVDQALREAGCTFREIDALAFSLDKPLIAVNHMEGHISANYITYPKLEPPFLCLVVSGGHTNIVKVEDYGRYVPLGATRDDAAGEAFDKVARILGRPDPGGPHLQKLAEQGNPDAYHFPKSFRGEHHLDFSFSGLKTAVINLVHRMEQRGESFNPADVAASFQKTVVRTLMENTFEAARREHIKRIALAGGVSANAALRQEAARGGFALYLPKLCYCTDNAAMIGSAAYYRMLQSPAAQLSLNADPSLPLL